MIRYNWWRTYLGTMGSKLPQLSSHPWTATIGCGPVPHTLPAIFPMGSSKEISSHFVEEEKGRFKTDLLHCPNLWKLRIAITDDIFSKSLKFDYIVLIASYRSHLLRKVAFRLSKPFAAESLIHNLSFPLRFAQQIIIHNIFDSTCFKKIRFIRFLKDIS